eukprot:6926503-Pyramimonas_sp.AAC.1
MDLDSFNLAGISDAQVGGMLGSAFSQNVVERILIRALAAVGYDVDMCDALRLRRYHPARVVRGSRPLPPAPSSGRPPSSASCPCSYSSSSSLVLLLLPDALSPRRVIFFQCGQSSEQAVSTGDSHG